MKKSIKILICVLVVIIVGMLLFLFFSKKKVNLDNVTIETINDESASTEERLFAYLLKLSSDHSVPWKVSSENTKVLYDSDKLPIYEVKCEVGTYRFKFSEEGIWCRLSKLEDFTQWDLDVAYEYGGRWSLVEDKKWHIIEQSPEEFKEEVETESESESEVVLKPMSENTDVDVSLVNPGDIWNTSLSDEQMSYAYLLHILKMPSAPWYGKDYKVGLVNAEDGVLEFMLTLDDVRYRLRVDEGGILYKFYKDSEFTEEEKNFLNLDVSGTWEEKDRVDEWYVMDRITYYSE